MARYHHRESFYWIDLFKSYDVSMRCARNFILLNFDFENHGTVIKNRGAQALRASDPSHKIDPLSSLGTLGRS